MLIILSDLHLTDGSTSVNVREDAFNDVLLKQISLQARKDLKEVRVVLLGDIFDLVRTSYWVSEVINPIERPWNGDLAPDTSMNSNPIVEQHYNKVLEGIIKKNRSSQALFNVLNSIKEKVREAIGRQVDTRVVYVIGNHDRALNNFQSLKDKIRSQVELVDVFEFSNVLDAPEYGVLARHGHEWDVHNHGFEFYKKVLKRGVSVDRFHPDCYRVQTIGEVITAELMAQLVYKIRLPENQEIIIRSLGSRSPDFNQQLMDINNIRPVTDVFLWIEWFGRNQPNIEMKNVLLTALKESIKAVLDTALAKQWDKMTKELWIFRGDITDRLEQLLEFIGNKQFDELKRSVELYKFFDNIFGRSKDDYVEGAKEEFRNGLSDKIQYLVYGHTHEARHDYFDGGIDGKVNMYINTGTYLPLIQRTQHNGFAAAHQMTMAFFYRADEDTENKKDQAPSIAIWNGIRRKTYV